MTDIAESWWRDLRRTRPELGLPARYDFRLVYPEPRNEPRPSASQFSRLR